MADRVEQFARSGRVDGILHLRYFDKYRVLDYVCMHVGIICDGPGLRARGVVWPTPFGHCSDREVAAELQLRQILARDRLTSARQKGYVLNYLKVWE